MQKDNRALVRVTTAIVALLLVRSANAEVSLGEMTRKCLQLENFWTLKSTQDTTGSIPNDGSSVCFGYLLAFRGLQGTVVGHRLRVYPELSSDAAVLHPRAKP